MMTCCDSSERRENFACPTCGTKGQPVTAVTIASLLLEVSKGRLQSGIDPFFCPDATCRIVYFARTGSETFTVDDLVVPVWQKRPGDPDVPVCYCFGHTLASIADEIQRTGQNSVLSAIAASVKAGACACEIRNPQGRCCLGNVATVVRALAPDGFS